MEGKHDFYLDIFKSHSNKFFIIKYKTRGQADQSLNNKVIFLQKRFDQQLRNAAQVCEQVGVFLSCLDQQSFIAFGTIQNEPTDFDYLTEEQQQNLSKLQEFFQSFVKVEWIFKGVLNFEKTKNIKNDLNEMKPVNHCKDVQELTCQTAEQLLSLLQKQEPYKPQLQWGVVIPQKFGEMITKNLRNHENDKQKSSKSRSRHKDKEKEKDKERRKSSKDRAKEKKSYDRKSRERRSKDRRSKERSQRRSKEKKKKSNEKKDSKEDIKSQNISEFVVYDNKDQKEKERHVREKEQQKEKDQREQRDRDRERERAKEQIEQRERDREKEQRQQKEQEKKDREEKEMMEKYKQKEKEREREKDRDREKEKEKDREREKEKEKERDKEKERERESNKERERDRQRDKDKDYNRDREKFDKGKYDKKDDHRQKERNDSKYDYDKKQKDKERERDKNREKSKEKSFERSDRKDRERRKDRSRGGDKERDRDNNNKKQKDYRRESTKKRSEERSKPRSRSEDRRQGHNSNKNKKILDLASQSEQPREFYSSVSLSSHKQEQEQQDLELEQTSLKPEQKDQVDLGVILNVLDSPKHNTQQFQPLIQPVIITQAEQIVLTKQSESQQSNILNSDSKKRILLLKEKSQSVPDNVEQQKQLNPGSMKIIKDAPSKSIQQITNQQCQTKKSVVIQDSKQCSGSQIRDRIILKKK